MNDELKTDAYKVQNKTNKFDFDTGLFLGRRHKKDKSPPMYSNKDEMTQFVIGYIKGYYERQT